MGYVAKKKKRKPLALAVLQVEIPLLMGFPKIFAAQPKYIINLEQEELIDTILRKYSSFYTILGITHIPLTTPARGCLCGCVAKKLCHAIGSIFFPKLSENAY